jgi:hypothetical protein
MIVRHRPEGDVRAPQQAGGHRRCDVVVAGQFLDDPDFVLLPDLGDPPSGASADRW